jgi:hypothetical protein
MGVRACCVELSAISYISVNGANEGKILYFKFNLDSSMVDIKSGTHDWESNVQSSRTEGAALPMSNKDRFILGYS